MKNELEQFLSLFERDFASFSIYCHLSLSFKANKRELISCTELSKKLGLGKTKLREKLAKLQKLNLIKTETKDKRGIFVDLLGPRLDLYRPSQCLKHNRLDPDRSRSVYIDPESVYIDRDEDLNLQNKASYKSSPSQSLDNKELCEFNLDMEKSLEVFKLIPNPLPTSYLISKANNLGLGSKTITKLETKTKSRVPAKKPRVKKLSYTPEDLKLAESWLESSLLQMKWSNPPKNWTAPDFAHEINKVKRIVDLNDEGMKALYEFVQNDDFWRDKVLSPSSLLKKSKNDVRKVDNILLRMKPRSVKVEEKIKKWSKDDEDISDLFIF